MLKPEILAPAGDLEKLQMAVVYGADAVYLAGSEFGMRAFAGNFSQEDMRAGVAFAHDRGAKVYVTVNIFAANDDILRLPPYLASLEKIGVDALIVADPGVFTLARENAPSLPCHLSTQANTTNWQSALFWQQAGFKRVVLARELSLQEISEIRDKVSIELEVFIHGSMCWAYSGRCYLSHFMEGRSANRGECAQACRWKYHLLEEKRPGEYMPVLEDERGIYIMNSRDLCLLDSLSQLVRSGVNSFKIEGRMKSVNYVATVTRVYRQALDACLSNPKNFTPNPAWHEELRKISHRPYSGGFMNGNPGADGQIYHTTAQEASHEFVGVVRSCRDGRATVEMRNRFAEGETLEITGPTTNSREIPVTDLRNPEGQPIPAAIRVQEHVSFHVPSPVEEYSLVRRKTK
ncbi:MAG: U32 family peptidase [Dethiobacter sp.]|nr:U32 family peptidase [Dethiobacter sp.]